MKSIIENKIYLLSCFKIIILVFLTTCHNPIMERWWDGNEGNESPSAGGNPVFHTVRFAAAGGYPAPEDQQIAHDGRVAKLLSMSKDSYGFGGWFRNANFTGSAWNFATDAVTEDITLHAMWSPITFNVTFDTNGGTPIPRSQWVTEGGRISEPVAMNRAGFGFGGWYASADFSGSPWNFNAAADALGNVIPADIVASSLVLYAKWDPSYEVVTFVANGGTPAPANQQVIRGGRIREPSPMIHNAGHGFGGWFTNANFTEEWNFAVGTIDSGLTLYAKWVETYHTVIFISNGGTPAPANQNVVFGKRLASPSAMTRTGESFGGWFSNSNFTGSEWNFAEDPVTSRLTLYAKWSPVTYTITFEANTGNPNQNPPAQNLMYGSLINKPAAINFDGHGFGGWFTDSNFANNALWDFFTGTVNRNITLYAAWDERRYTITFDTGGSVQPVENQTIAHGGKIIPPQAISFAGHGFGGWFKEPNLVNEWNFATDIVTSNLILYARWDANYHTVTFNANGGSPPPETQRIVYGFRVVNPPAMIKTGESFGGWFRDSALTVPWNFAAPVNGNETLHAKWSPVTYTVTFEANTGNPALNPSSQNLTHGSRVVKPPSMNLDGYGFGGWFTDMNFSQEWNFIENTVNRNMVLYANWEIEYYTATFISNGGTPAPSPQNLIYGSGVIKPAAMNRTGFGFGGWFTDANLTNEWDFITDKMSKDITLYASWEPSPYVVTFIANGGSPSPGTQNVIYENRVVRPPAMTRTGFSFGGWFKDTDFAAEWDFAADTIKGNTTLHARWIRNLIVFTVAFDGNMGYPYPSDQRIVEGSKAIEPPSLSRTGFGFGGWFEDSAFTGSAWNFAAATVNKDITLYAKWETNHYTVTFESNGGTPAPNHQDVVYQARAKEPLAMNRVGYGFNGWFMNSNFTVPWNFSADIITENITLYAHWVTNYYTITFEANGGTPAPGNISVAHGGTITEPPAMTRHLHGFGGWFTDPRFTNQWNFETGTAITGMTLYARWDEGRYTVRFEANGGFPPPPDQNVTASVFGAMITEPTVMRKAGFVFDGWFTERESFDLNNWWDFNESLVTQDMILYARWVPQDSNLVWVPTGSFIMGDDKVSGARPARRVRVSGFYMDRFEISQARYLEVLSATGTTNTPGGTLANPSNSLGDITRPIERVSWFDAVYFCNLLSELEGLEPAYEITDIVRTPISGTGTPGILSITSATVTINWNASGFRLPTEAEWEFAARGGNGSPGNFIYAGSNNPDDVAWYNQTANGVTHTVGTKAPNGLGLFDMSGNVSEWCCDWFDADYYSVGPQDNPRGPDFGTERVRRGGAWSNAYSNVRSVVRNSFAPSNNTWVMGFRVVRPYSPQ